MQFLEFCAEREFIKEDVVATFKEQAVEFLKRDSEIESLNSSVLQGVSGLRSSADLTNLEEAEAKKVVEAMYRSFFRYLDTSSDDPTRKIIQNVDEYIAQLDDDDTYPVGLKEYLSLKDVDSGEDNQSVEIEATNKSNDEVAFSEEELNQFVASFSCQLEAIDPGLLGQYFSIFNDDVKTNLIRMAGEANSYDDVGLNVVSELEVIASACGFVELPVSETIMRTIIGVVDKEEYDFGRFPEYFEKGMELSNVVYEELKSTGSECKLLNDANFTNEFYRWVKLGKAKV